MAGRRDFRSSEEKTERRAAEELIGTYHQAQLRLLLEHVREGFVRLDRGEIDEFELDRVIFQYKRSAAELWKFCGSGGAQTHGAAIGLAYMRERGEEPDWWEAGVHRDRRT
jgi:hypothetical protein